MATSPRRLLVVDDNIDSAQSLALLLEALGHEARCVYDGSAALREAAAYRPEMVLLDLGLPGMDGFEVARRLRSTQPDVTLVALTGYGQDGDRARTREAGFAEHLLKPVDVERLLRLLDGSGRGGSPVRD